MSGKLNRCAIKRSSYFSALLVCIVLCAGALAIFWQFHRGASTSGVHAANSDAGNFISSPTLSAASVDTILRNAGSAMAGNGATIERVARQYTIDDAFALAVWSIETSYGMAGVGLHDHNPGGVRSSANYPAAYDGYAFYPSYANGIEDWFYLVSTRYVSRGLTSAYTLCYSYVGTSSAAQWAAKVVRLVALYRGDAAPPEPTPQATATPQPTVAPTTPSIAHLAKGMTTKAPSAAQTNMPRRVPLLPSTHTVAQAPMPVLLIIIAGLLAAFVLAGWGVKIGSTVITATEMMVTLASPQTLPVTSPLSPEFTKSRAALFEDVFLAEGWQDVRSQAMLPQPLQRTRPTPRLFPPASSLLPIPNNRQPGLLTSATYRNTEALKHRLVPLATESDDDQQMDDDATLPRMQAVSYAKW